MTDVMTKAQRSITMSRIRGKNTTTELHLRKSLFSKGLRFRIHYALPGKPDIVFVRQKVVIFIDGCFWHRCPKHYHAPRTRPAFWKNKIRSNVVRDRKTDRVLRKMGWRVIRIWEHQLQAQTSTTAERIARIIR